MTIIPVIRRPRSIRGRCTAAMSLLVLIVLAALSASACLCVRHILGSDAYTQADPMAGPGVSGLLRAHRLEYLAAALVLISAAGTGVATWWALGRALRPVQAIRAELGRVTANDLGRRMRVPPGDDEIAELARTTNQTLARLDEAFARQRHFVATTSHELRNPITGLRAELEDALAHPEDTDPLRTLRTALNIADRLDTIVNDLLAQARTDAAVAAPGHELIDLTDLLTQEAARTNGTRTRTGLRDAATVDAEHTAHARRANGASAAGSGGTHARGPAGARANGPGGVPRSIPVRLHVQGDVWVCGSRIQVVRALANLLSNARRHASTAVDLTLTTAGGQAVIAVTDDGPGIPPGDRRRVFEHFTRLEDARRLDSGGSGLGLAITRDIARRHHGSLTLEDSPKGTRFVLRVPHLDPPAVFPYESAHITGTPKRSEERRPGHSAKGDSPAERTATDSRRSVTLS